MTKTTYTEMVDPAARDGAGSGIEWIGKVPRGWEVRKLKRSIKIASWVSLWNELFDEDWEYSVIWWNWEMSRTNEFNCNENVIVIWRVWAHCGNIHLINKKCWITDNALIVSNINWYDLNYLAVFLKSRNLNDIASRSAQPLITWTQIKDQYVCKPPLEIQQAIASYLDTKTAQIDEAISLKTQQIELLREKRTALINHVVTKWLDPDVELVDSGIEWIGTIPKGWEVRKLKWLIDLINRWMSPDYSEDETSIKIINQGCICWWNLNLQKIKYNIENSALTKRWKLNKWDILMNSTWTGTLGRAVVFDIDDLWYYADSHVTIIRTNTQNHSKYITYLLSTEMYQNYIYQTCVSGSTNQIELSREKMRIVEFLSPSFQEQQDIASYLDTKTAEIDSTIALVQQSIDLLVEYKQSLISHVVTGKVKIE